MSGRTMTREAKAIFGGVAVFIILVGMVLVFDRLVMQMMAAAARSGGEIAFWKRLAIGVNAFLGRDTLFLGPAVLAACILGSLRLVGRESEPRQ